MFVEIDGFLGRWVFRHLSMFLRKFLSLTAERASVAAALNLTYGVRSGSCGEKI